MSKNYIVVDGEPLPHPTEFSVTANDIDSENSTRSEGTGVLTRERIRQGVHEIDYSVDFLTDTDLARLQNIFAPEYVMVDFWWGKSGRAKMYGSSPNASICSYDPTTDTTYWSFSINLTEY